MKTSYTWGMDLSGSIQGAGGVGGLLLTTDYSLLSTGEAYYPTYDGNGNISEYIDDSGVIQAHYEYDAFGRTVAQSGAKANDFAHRFSTKPKESFGEFYYYGYRFYDAGLGRWLNRDPIEEDGGFNLYMMLLNRATNGTDYLGMYSQEHAYWTEAFSPVVDSLTDTYNTVMREVERSIDDSVSTVKGFFLEEMSRYNSESRHKVSYSKIVGRKWESKKLIVFTARTAASISVVSDGCCVKVKWGPKGGITGKIPTKLPGVTIRPAGSVAFSSSYQYCWSDNSQKLDVLTMSVNLSLGVRAGVDADFGIGKVEAWIEAGGYVSGKWDLINGGREYNKGLYFRAVKEYSVLGYYDREEVKYTSGGDFDTL